MHYIDQIPRLTVEKISPYIKMLGAGILSFDDSPAQPSQYLISSSLEAIRAAQVTALDDISARIGDPPHCPDIWPGEHYRLLAGFVKTLKPELIVEIGTYTGVSTLSLKKFLPQGSRLVTFDIKEWRGYHDTCLKDDDLDGALVQHVEDLSDINAMLKYKTVLENADIILIGALKDGARLRKILNNFYRISFNKKPLMVLDDIRLRDMYKVWDGIDMPKLDLTFFGHSTGTGLVEWKY
jgi:predicted O-methyltransferase YrrM